jgi:hypothetical protein
VAISADFTLPKFTPEISGVTRTQGLFGWQINTHTRAHTHWVWVFPPKPESVEKKKQKIQQH